MSYVSFIENSVPLVDFVFGLQSKHGYDLEHVFLVLKGYQLKIVNFLKSLGKVRVQESLRHTPS